MFKRTLVIALSLMIGSISLAWSDVAVAPAFGQGQEATRARQTVPPPAAEATVILNEQFLNALLEVMFTRLRAPSYPISIGRLGQKDASPAETQKKNPPASNSLAAAGQSGCASVVVLEREMDGVKT